MKIEVTTAVLNDILELAIVNQNLSNFHQKSLLAEVTIEDDMLRINHEAASVMSEVVMKGKKLDSEFNISSIFVSCSQLKSIVKTFDGTTTSIEITDHGLQLTNKSSKFMLDKVLDSDDISLNRPSNQPGAGKVIALKNENWKFINDHQMYAISVAYVHPVYTKVWVDEGGQCIIGDFDNSIFTVSNMSQLEKRCLLEDTIINLFNSLPEGAEIIDLGDSYRIEVKTDAYDFKTQFKPKSEDDEDMGSYNSDIILQLMDVDESSCILVDKADIEKFLSQSTILTSNTEAVISFIVEDGKLKLKDDRISCTADIKDGKCDNFTIKFKTSQLQQFISKLDTPQIDIACLYGEDGNPAGIVAVTDNMSAMLSGVDDEF